MKRAMLCAAFLATVPAANWLIGHIGACVPNGPCLVPVGFGLMAPSGVLMIGAALVLRDLIREQFGLVVACGLVVAGGLLSLALAPAQLAPASIAAFVVAEAFDAAVYEPLRSRGRALAVLADRKSTS